MRILKKILRIFAILLPCLIGVLFFNNKTYAVSDISITYNSTVTQYDNVFPTCTGDCLNDYQYLIVEITQPYYSAGSSYFDLYIRFDGSYQRVFTFSTSNNYAIYKLPFNGSANNFLSFRSTNYSFLGSVTFTLTESYQSGSPSGSITLTQNGTYDVTSYAEAVVDVPVEFLPGDYDDEFNGVINAIYICGASAIMIYFFYIIYGIFIKPTGGYK